MAMTLVRSFVQKYLLCVLGVCGENVILDRDDLTW
jgi:hypothetical protein